MSANDVVGTLTRGLKEIHLDDSELDDRTVIGESELVRRYDEINAKTMYNMMEARHDHSSASSPASRQTCSPIGGVDRPFDQGAKEGEGESGLLG